MIVHFIDRTKIILQYPQQTETDPTTMVSNVKKALEADKIVAEVQGDLIVIPVRNIKYIQVSPAPDELPKGVLRNVQIVE
jgi:hypothetical protein